MCTALRAALRKSATVSTSARDILQARERAAPSSASSFTAYSGSLNLRDGFLVPFFGFGPPFSLFWRMTSLNSATSSLSEETNWRRGQGVRLEGLVGGGRAAGSP